MHGISWQTFLAVGAGGALGAVSRVYLNGLINTKIPHDLPLGTLGVNLIGSLIMGMLFAYFLHTTFLSMHIKSFLSTGILGALTTYSTFAIESFILLQTGSYFLAVSNMALNTVGTVVMAGIGFTIINLIFAP